MKRRVKINVIREKKLVNNVGKTFRIVEVLPEVIWILDNKNNFITYYCGTIDEDEDNLKIINQKQEA